jgi:hypothetical protein
MLSQLHPAAFVSSASRCGSPRHTRVRAIPTRKSIFGHFPVCKERGPRGGKIYNTTQEQPWLTALAFDSAEAALLPGLIASCCPFFFISSGDLWSGLSDTFTGVGCVLKVGMRHSSSVFVSGERNPLPMQTSLKLSMSEQSGTSITKRFVRKRSSTKRKYHVPVQTITYLLAILTIVTS